MKLKKYKKITTAQNPMISVVVTKKEYEWFEDIAEDYGVSLPQVVRGFMRYGRALYTDTDDYKEILVEGKLRRFA
jgi:hypothetical protein